MTEKKQPQWLRWVMRGIITVCVAGVVGGGCGYINNKIGLEDDHFLEELTERYIEKELDLKIDLTPETPEN